MEPCPEPKQEVDSKKKPEEGTIVSSGPLYKKTGLCRGNQASFPFLTFISFMTKITPMLEQYLEIKEKYQDFVLFYQLGDFFEMFYEDALLASRILEITLTSRHKGEQKNQVPMCGVPVHAVSGYVSRMVEKGYKVALCEQVEDPSQAQGIVRREVTRLITPGLYIDDTSIKSNRYLLSLSFQESRFGLASVDLATGEFRVTEVADPEKALEEVGRINPSEILVSRAAKQNPFLQPFLERLSSYFLDLWGGRDF